MCGGGGGGEVGVGVALAPKNSKSNMCLDRNITNSLVLSCIYDQFS